MSCKSAKRLQSRLYAKHGKIVPIIDVPNLTRTNTQREILVPKPRKNAIVP